MNERIVSTIEELDALPIGVIVRTVESAELFVKDQIRITTSWWVTTNQQYDFESKDISLPVEVLWEPKGGRG